MWCHGLVFSMGWSPSSMQCGLRLHKGIHYGCQSKQGAGLACFLPGHCTWPRRAVDSGMHPSAPFPQASCLMETFQGVWSKLPLFKQAARTDLITSWAPFVLDNPFARLSCWIHKHHDQAITKQIRLRRSLDTAFASCLCILAHANVYQPFCVRIAIMPLFRWCAQPPC